MVDQKWIASIPAGESTVHHQSKQCHNSLFFLCVIAVILLGVARDLLVDRRIHKVYLIAVPVLFVS
ncbi:MAG: hypothetical protein WBX22_22820 [Silvibacterium sp.]